jgi:hypothetical protein
MTELLSILKLTLAYHGKLQKRLQAGLDFELLDSRLKGSFDVYNKTTTNVILNTRPYVTSGISNSSPAHVGEVSNKGIDCFTLGR